MSLSIKIIISLFLILTIISGEHLIENNNIEYGCQQENGQNQCTKIPIIKISENKIQHDDIIDDKNKQIQDEKQDIPTAKTIVYDNTFAFSQSNVQNLILKHKQYFQNQNSTLIYFPNKEDIQTISFNSDSKDKNKANPKHNHSTKNNNKNQKSQNNIEEKDIIDLDDIKNVKETKNDNINLKINKQLEGIQQNKWKYLITILNTIPVYEKGNKNQIMLFNLNIFRQHEDLIQALDRFESKNVEYKLRSVFFLPNIVKMYPQTNKLLGQEMQILRLFQEKKGTDCILYLKYSNTEYDYFFLPISNDFHFDYVELKDQNDLTQLNSFQQLIKQSKKTLIINIPPNLMILDDEYCVVHSFGLITSFTPMISYANMGYVLCSSNVFETIFGDHLTYEDSKIKSYTFQEILEKSEQVHNYEANQKHKFSYSVIVQIKQIIAYLGIILQEQLKLIQLAHKLQQQKNKENQNNYNNIQQNEIYNVTNHHYGLFKIIATIDQNSRLTLYKVQNTEEILEEDFPQNSSILEEALSFIHEIENNHDLNKKEIYPEEYKMFKKVYDERKNYAYIEKTDNIIVLTIDKIQKTFYYILKWFISLF